MVNSRPTVLINYSGGIDSVYAAWRALKDGERPILHHCVLKNKTLRYPHEKRAVSHTLHYFNKVGLKDYVYVESGFDYGSLGHLIFDVEIIGFLTGVVLRNAKYRQVDRVIVSVNKDDPTGRDINNFRRVHANLYAESVIDKPIKWEYPMIHMSKAEIMADMPRDLLKLCFWCRRPKSNGSYCGQCKSCREVVPILKELT
jgi:7-cyano-7-deazaguanine synthase in queuosine biosynthesis